MPIPTPSDFHESGYAPEEIPLHIADLFDGSPSPETPIACDLSSLKDPEQHKQDSEALWNEREELRAVTGGYALRFPGTMDYAERLLDFVGRERQCCPFLTFHIVFEPEGRGIWLYVGGNEQVRRYLSEQFGQHAKEPGS